MNVELISQKEKENRWNNINRRSEDTQIEPREKKNGESIEQAPRKKDNLSII